MQRKKYTLPVKPKAQKTSDLATNPEEYVEEMLETISNFMKVGTIIMKWIKKNRGALIAVLELAVAITLHVSEVIILPEPWATIILVIMYGAPVVTAVLTTGFTSTSTQEAYDNLKNALKEKKKSSKEEIAANKRRLTTAQNAYNKVVAELEDMEFYKSNGLHYDANAYALKQATKVQLENTIKVIEESIENA